MLALQGPDLCALRGGRGVFRKKKKYQKYQHSPTTLQYWKTTVPPIIAAMKVHFYQHSKKG